MRKLTQKTQWSNVGMYALLILFVMLSPSLMAQAPSLGDVEGTVESNMTNIMGIVVWVLRGIMLIGLIFLAYSLFVAKDGKAKDYIVGYVIFVIVWGIVETMAQAS